MKGLLIYFGLVIIGFIIAWLWSKYGPNNNNDDTTPPGFRWGD